MAVSPPVDYRLRSLITGKVLVVSGKLSLLGEGSYGAVYALDKHSVIKVSRSPNGNIPYSLLREAAHIFPLQHPNVVRLIDALISPERLAIVLPRAGQTLTSYNSNSWKSREGNRPGIDLDVAKDIILQIARGLAYLRSYSILHGDLKPDNILIYDEPNCLLRVVIADLGIASTGLCYEDQEYRGVFTLPYRSPELALGTYYREPSDSWALGCVAAEILTGKRLFDASWVAANENADLLYLHMRLLGHPQVDWPGVTEYDGWDSEMVKNIDKARKVRKATDPLPTISEKDQTKYRLQRDTRYSYNTAKGGVKILGAEEHAFLNSLVAFDPEKRKTIEQVAYEDAWLSSSRSRLDEVACQRLPERIADCKELLLKRSYVLSPSKSDDTLLRAKLVNWMHARFIDLRLKYRSLALGVSLLDRYSSVVEIRSEDSSYLLAAVAVHLGSQLCEYTTVDIEDVVRPMPTVGVTDDKFNERQRALLERVGVDVYRTTVYDIVRYYGSFLPVMVRRLARVFVMLSHYTRVEEDTQKELVALCCISLGYSAGGVLYPKEDQTNPYLETMNTKYGKESVSSTIQRFCSGLTDTLRMADKDLRKSMLTRQRVNEDIPTPADVIRSVPLLVTFAGSYLDF